jgi:hypothetical protein
MNADAMFLIGVSTNYMNSFMLKLAAANDVEICGLLVRSEIIYKSTVIWAVNAFVLATPISKPAYVTKVNVEFLANCEVDTFTIESVLHVGLTISKATRVSLVSPD